MAVLSGVRVLEVGTALAGPYAATLLSDMGAEVVKLEKPGRGDLIRFTDSYVRGTSGYFLGINRGKRGLTADVRTEEGQEIVRKLVLDHDVLIENFRYGRMAEWGLGYEELSSINPGLIYCSLSMFGPALGFEEQGGNDAVAQAYSGILDLTGDPDRPPSKTGAPVVDVSGSMLATIAILGALIRRQSTQIGEHIQLSLLEAAYATMPNYVVSCLNGDPGFQRLGSGHPQLVPYQAFRCRDGQYLVVGAFHRESWRRLCKALGRPDLLEDKRFEENWDRVAHHDELIPILEMEILREDAEHWMQTFTASDIPTARVLTLKESLEFFETRLPGMVVTAQHAELGDIRMLRTPFRYLQGEADERELRAAPSLGQDTDDILRHYGYTDEEIQSLRAAKRI